MLLQDSRRSLTDSILTGFRQIATPPRLTLMVAAKYSQEQAHTVYPPLPASEFDESPEPPDGPSTVGDRDTRQSTLKAVHDDDLETVLRSLGIYPAFIHHKLKCKFCRDIITWNNLHSIFADGGTVKCSCCRPECVKALVAYKQGVGR